VARFLSVDREVLEPLDPDGKPAQILVKRDALVVRHAERERFEAEQAKLPPLEAAVQSAAAPERRRGRGAPVKFDWEGALIEMIVSVNEEGVPATQEEMMGRMRNWFAKVLGPDNVPCDSSIRSRVKRFDEARHPEHARQPVNRGRVVPEQGQLVHGSQEDRRCPAINVGVDQQERERLAFSARGLPPVPGAVGVGADDAEALMLAREEAQAGGPILLP